MAKENEARKIEKVVSEGSFLQRLLGKRKKIEQGVDTGETTTAQMQDAEEIKPDKNARRGYTREDW